MSTLVFIIFMIFVVNKYIGTYFGLSVLENKTRVVPRQ